MHRARVLVVNPPNAPFTDPGLLIEPIDVLTVATFIRDLGHDVRVLDMDIEQLAPAAIGAVFSSFRPEFTVIPFDYHIPLFTAEAIPHAAEIARLAAASGSRVAIGGRPSNHYPEAFFSVCPDALIVLGEMEPAMAELLSGAAHDQVAGLLYRQAAAIVRNAPRKGRFDLTRLPIPDRSLLNVNRYIDVRSLLSSRGCVERCSFCPVHTFWGKWRARPATLVVDEIEYLVEEYGAKKILFLDDHAMVDARRLREISEQIITRGLRVALGCLGTARSADPATLDLMQRAGFRWVHFGAEFADDAVLEALGKRLTCKQIRAAILAAKNAGMRVRTSWIFDLPDAGERGLQDTVDLILETEPDEIRAHFLALRAGAPLAERQLLAGGAAAPQQYIHAAAPHANFSALPAGRIERELERLVSGLTARGYVAVRSAAEWSGAARGHLAAGARFISFCPGRYGVGWSI